MCSTIIFEKRSSLERLEKCNRLSQSDSPTEEKFDWAPAQFVSLALMFRRLCKMPDVKANINFLKIKFKPMYEVEAKKKTHGIFLSRIAGCFVFLHCCV